MSKELAPLILVSLIATLVLFLPTFALLLTTPPEGYLEAVSDSEVISAILLSIITASLAAIWALVLGVPLAYILARKSFPGKGLVDSLLDIPILLPHTVAGIALLVVFGPREIIGKPLSLLGIIFTGTIHGIVLAQFFVSAPLLIKVAKSVFEKIPEEIPKAARVLGAGELRTFFEVELPLASRGIASGAVLCWARAISEFGAVVILAYYPYTAPVLIFYKFTTSGLKAAQPAAALLVVITLGIFALIKAVGGEEVA